ncbi:hypothetical protein DFH28DRAFT_1196493 [Melampsora americana]|nr:hypothetical protein DFH28DRAFT_1196493 [Melampsora americana]
MSSQHKLPLETFNTTDLSSKADAHGITGTQLTPGAIQIDPSTLSQVLTGAIQLAQSSSSAIKKKTSIKMRQPRSSKPPAKSSSKTKPAKMNTHSRSRNSKVNKNKKTKKARSESDANESSEDEEDESGVTKKKNPHWENDDNGNGKSSMYLLIDWLTEEGDYDRYKDNKCKKRGVAEEIEKYMIDHGIFSRDASTIGKKITRLEKAWRDANTIRCRTEKAALAPILKKCKYYFELKPFMETRHGNTRLAPAQSLANDNTNDVEFISSGPRRTRDHSIVSNLPYENKEDDINQRQASANLEQHDHVGQSDESMEDINHLLGNEEDDGDLSASNPITPSRPSEIQYQAQKSNVHLNHTNSKSLLGSSSLGSSRKRHSSGKSGSAASIQDLIKNNPLDNEIDIINSPISRLLSQKLDRLSQLANTDASNMFPPPEKNFLNEDDSKKKAKIELNMATVQLKSEKKKLEQHGFDLLSRREKHNLEMLRYQAEIKHEQITRNAQLISMLMKDNNLTLQDAMMAAQTAQAMSASTSALASTSSLQSSATKDSNEPLSSDE